MEDKMSKNVLYANEIATANRFVIEHAAEPVLQEFLAQIRDMSWLPHSERWSSSSLHVLAVSCNLETQFQNEFNCFNRGVTVIFLLFLW